MKAKNNVQKTALKSAVAATGLVILSFTVNAQIAMRPLFETKETNNIAMVTGKMSHNSFASTANTKNSATADAFAAYLVNETEEPLQLEDWMTNETNFTMFQIETKTESPLEIEDWMTNESNFDANTFSIEVETEKELILEDWMLDESHFNGNQNNVSNKPKASIKIISTSTFVYREVNNESALKIEDWMINPKIWKK